MKLPPGHVAGQGVVKPKCTGGFGERMLLTMGWETGQGLGREGHGIKEAIVVKKKEDTVGVGGNGSYAWGDKWWEKAFDSAVATVDDDSSDSSDSDSDDERMAGIVAAVNRDGTRTSASADELKLLASLSKKGGRMAAGRFGGRDAKMARIRQQEASWAAEAAEKAGISSGATTGGVTGGLAAGASDQSDTTSEVQLSAGSGKKRKAAAAGGGGGEPSTGQAASSGKDAKKGRKAKAAAAGAEAAAGEVQAGQQQQQHEGEEQAQAPKKQRIVIEPSANYVAPVYDFTQTPATGWWGAKRFTSVGCLEGLDKTAAEKARQRMTFTEDDQADIWTNAQAKKTQGKVGLGQGTGTVKVGGVKWEGKKVTFEAEEGGDAEAAAAAAAAAAGGGKGKIVAVGSSTQLAALAAGEQQAAAAAGGAAAEDAGKRSGKGKKAKAGSKAAAAAGAAAVAAAAAAAEAAAAAATAAASGSWEEGVKWRKIITQHLEAAEQHQLKLKELQRLVVAAVLEKHAALVSSKAAIKAAFVSRLEGSSKFVVEGKVVRLRG